MKRGKVWIPIVVLGAAAFFWRFSMGHGNPASEDDQIKVLLARPGAVEVLSWLETAPMGSRFVGGGYKEYDQVQATALVRELYRRGAVKVTAIDIVNDQNEEGEDVQYTATLIVELPDEPTSRKRLFDLDASEVQPEYDPAVENGQRYFMLWWD
ncbi:MAG: hypothetical protein ABI353_10435 [Isosphaeraceae bacterium]